jgi:hemoglobin
MRTIRQILFAAMLGLILTAQAQQAPSSASLYHALGAQAGIEKLVDNFVMRLVADPRIKEQFAKTNLVELRARLSEQFCVVSGGPCVYKGADMKSAHSNLDITRADFNALVEGLQLAMDQQGIAFTVQNQLLARLAPMHRDVITVRTKEAS